LLNISQLWSGSIKCQDIYFSQNNVREILDKFKVNNCNSMSALIEFGLNLNRNHEGKKVKDTLYKKILGS
jgi:hypothetical protein